MLINELSQLIVTDPRILKFYARNPQLDVNMMNVLLINLLEPITQSLSENNIDSSHNTLLLKGVTQNVKLLMESNQAIQNTTVALSYRTATSSLRF